MEAEKYLREARMEIAATLKADEKEIYFTSGGTESDNCMNMKTSTLTLMSFSMAGNLTAHIQIQWF